MNITYNFYKPAVLAFFLLIIPVMSQAAPRALLQNSSTYALGNEFRAYRVPTVDSLGKIKYYDIRVILTVNNDGSLAPIADVLAPLSPIITTKVLVPGTYKSADGFTICTVTNIVLTNARIQSFLACSYNTSTKFDLSVATGTVAWGHPYHTELLSYGINKRSDVGTQTWGLVTNGLFRIGSCGYYGEKYPIGAKTDGKILTLSVYTKTDPSSYYCSGTLTKL